MVEGTFRSVFILLAKKNSARKMYIDTGGELLKNKGMLTSLRTLISFSRLDSKLVERPYGVHVCL